MIADFHILTITHQDLNVDELGHFVIDHSDKADLGQKLQSLAQKFSIKELIYLSTCNRITFITYDHHIWDLKLVKEFFAEVNSKLDDEKLDYLPKIVRNFHGEEAINHLFEVASSIDSLVVGEREIFRQFREAYHFSKKWGLIGDNLRLLEKYTVQAAKAVYAQTKIGEKPLSIVSLAIQKLLDRKQSTTSKILLIGAGETNTKMAKFLLKHGYTNVAVFNRNLHNASEISTLLQAPAYHLKELKDYKAGFEVMIVCTGATSSLIDAELYKSLIREETDEKLIIDLSVPHNVDKEVPEIFAVEYVNIDHLRNLAEENLEFRKEEVLEARKILKTERKNFLSIYQQRSIERAMRAVPEEIKSIKKKALETVFKKEIDTLDSSAQALVSEMMDYMEKKCISVPMKLAKKAGK